MLLGIEFFDKLEISEFDGMIIDEDAFGLDVSVKDDSFFVFMDFFKSKYQIFEQFPYFLLWKVFTFLLVLSHDLEQVHRFVLHNDV